MSGAWDGRSRGGARPAGRPSPGCAAGRRVPWPAVAGLALLAALAGVRAGDVAASTSDERPVHVVALTGSIDPGQPAYLERALAEAERAGAAAVLLEVDTPGGRLDAALRMQSALLDAPVPTVAFVDGMALSAGALLTIATEEIYLAPGSTLGAATPVLGSGEPADEKTVSAVRGAFRATADARGRDPEIAEAMVDPEVVVEGLAPAGTLLTLDPEQALAHGYAEEVVPDRAAALEAAGLGGAEVVDTGPSPAESLARVLTHPVVAWVLVNVAVLLLLADLSSGGLGAPAALAAACFAVFFWGHAVAGLAGWEDVALVVVGAGLIALELLVIPGTGLAGLLGAAALLGGVVMAQLGRELVTPDQLQQAAAGAGVTVLAMLAVLVVAVRLLTRHGPPRALGLTARVGSGEPVTARASGGWLRLFGGDDLVLAGAGGAADADEASGADRDRDRPAEAGSAGTDPTRAGAPEGAGALAGAEGVATSALRPAGVAEIHGERVDVVSDGDYIPAGEPVVVVRDEGYRRVVRRASADAPHREP